MELRPPPRQPRRNLADVERLRQLAAWGSGGLGPPGWNCGPWRNWLKADEQHWPPWGSGGLAPRDGTAAAATSAQARRAAQTASTLNGLRQLAAWGSGGLGPPGWNCGSWRNWPKADEQHWPPWGSGGLAPRGWNCGRRHVSPGATWPTLNAYVSWQRGGPGGSAPRDGTAGHGEIG